MTRVGERRGADTQIRPSNARRRMSPQSTWTDGPFIPNAPAPRDGINPRSGPNAPEIDLRAPVQEALNKAREARASPGGGRGENSRG